MRYDEMANEYQIRAWKDDSEEWSPRGAYSAGFLAARKMAYVELIRLGVIDPTNADTRTISYAIATLGEE